MVRRQETPGVAEVTAFWILSYRCSYRISHPQTYTPLHPSADAVIATPHLLQIMDLLLGQQTKKHKLSVWIFCFLFTHIQILFFSLFIWAGLVAKFVWHRFSFFVLLKKNCLCQLSITGNETRGNGKIRHFVVDDAPPPLYDIAQLPGGGKGGEGVCRLFSYTSVHSPADILIIYQFSSWAWNIYRSESVACEWMVKVCILQLVEINFNDDQNNYLYSYIHTGSMFIRLSNSIFVIVKW